MGHWNTRNKLISQHGTGNVIARSRRRLFSQQVHVFFFHMTTLNSLQDNALNQSAAFYANFSQLKNTIPMI